MVFLIVNDNLQQQIKSTYEYWFYQFNFSDNQGLPYALNDGALEWNSLVKRNIPVGWKVQNMYSNDLFSVISSGITSFIGAKRYLATADIDKTNIYEGSIITYDTRESRANMQPTQNSVWFAKMKNSIKHLFISNNMLDFVNQTILSTGFYGFQCSSTSFEYVSSIVSAPIFETNKDMLSHGATQQGIGDDDLKNMKLIIPDDSTLEKYHNLTCPLYLKLSKNIMENKRLTQIRDCLLPLLMSGQATIE